jgi:predicted DsbA family dithiol-disulfide isomerase
MANSVPADLSWFPDEVLAILERINGKFHIETNEWVPSGRIHDVKIHHGWIAFLILTLASAAAGQSGSKSIAVVNGENITEEQLKTEATSALEALGLKRTQAEATFNREESEIMEKALNRLIEEKLLSAEAAKRKTSREQLVQSEIDGKVVEPNPREMAQFYDDNRANIPVPFEQAAPEIREYMIRLRRDQAREAFFSSLKRDYSVKSFFEPIRVDIPTEGYPSVGPSNAPVTIVEFSDFQCPYCGNLFPVLKEIEAKYADKVRVVYRQFPLTQIHPYAQKAAEASLCAKEQNKFWEYHDSLFANQDELSVDALMNRAAELKLDTGAFKTCLESGSQAAAVRKDIDDGYKAGVTGTPALYINGRPYRGESSFEAIANIIDDELLRKNIAK